MKSALYTLFVGLILTFAMPMLAAEEGASVPVPAQGDMAAEPAIDETAATVEVDEVVDPHLQATIERIKPIGDVYFAGEALPAPVEVELAADAGKKRYETTCHTCHGAGVAGAPIFGDKAAWAPRIAKGMDTLLQHALNGFNSMPPRGTCTTCSDKEIEMTIQYMIEQSS